MALVKQPTTMQAACYHAYGSPDVLNVSNVSCPQAGDDEVLVQVHASTVNRTDCGFLRGKPFIVRFFSGLFRPKSTILGCEFSGQIVAIGKNVKHYKTGDRVMGFKDDDFGFGGHAGYTTVPAEAMLAHIPEQFSYEQAAPAFEGAHYALHYIRAANMQKQKRVLINGATGAIGSAAVQLLQESDVHITAVCATEHISLVSQLGADCVIDYRQQDFTELPQQFDVIFDAVGKSTFGKCRRILTENGIYMSTELGPFAQNPLLAIATSFTGKQKVLFPLPANSQKDALYLSELMARGTFRPVIDRVYPLAEIADAFRYVETGMKTGNVVLQIPVMYSLPQRANGCVHLSTNTEALRLHNAAW